MLLLAALSWGIFGADIQLLRRKKSSGNTRLERLVEKKQNACTESFLIKMESVFSDPLAVIKTTIGILEHFNVSYLVGGSFASSVHGRMRTTQDIDFLCQLEHCNLDELIAAFLTDFFVYPEALRDAVRNKRCFNIIHKQTAFKVDIFTKVDRFEREQLKRAVEIQPYGSDFTVRVATAEDTIIAKLRWYRLGNEVSERQWSDVQGIFELRQQELDRDYLFHWANELKLEDLLSKLL